MQSDREMVCDFTRESSLLSVIESPAQSDQERLYEEQIKALLDDDDDRDDTPPPTHPVHACTQGFTTQEANNTASSGSVHFGAFVRWLTPCSGVIVQTSCETIGVQAFSLLCDKSALRAGTAVEFELVTREDGSKAAERVRLCTVFPVTGATPGLDIGHMRGTFLKNISGTHGFVEHIDPSDGSTRRLMFKRSQLACHPHLLTSGCDVQFIRFPNREGRLFADNVKCIASFLN